MNNGQYIDLFQAPKPEDDFERLRRTLHWREAFYEKHRAELEKEAAERRGESPAIPTKADEINEIAIDECMEKKQDNSNG